MCEKKKTVYVTIDQNTLVNLYVRKVNLGHIAAKAVAEQLKISEV